MTNKNVDPIRVDGSWIAFSNKGQSNRVIAGIDKKVIEHRRFSKVVVNFFKKYNEAYLLLIQMEEKNND